MKTIGIIAEYNPFHSGHAFQISEARRLFGADRIIVIMSGSFVQRGEPACADKFTRARWAALHGADMVVELPDVFSLSCAERFASGALRILKGTGLIDGLCFGSESGDAEMLREAALSKPDGESFREGIAAGLSYPKALSEAYGKELSPNDILGAEYIRANEKYSCGFEILPVKREGSYGDPSLEGEFSSALAIRNALGSCPAGSRMTPAVFDGLSRALPRDVLDDIARLIRTGEFPSTADGLSDALVYRMRCMSAGDLASLPEISEGLENLFKKYSQECGEINELLDRIKSKRYTMARLKRSSMCALLGVTRELQNAACEDDSALYARVLAVREASRGLITDLKNKAAIPVVIQASDRDALSPAAREVERISALAHSVRAIGQPYEKAAESDASHRLITV